MMGLLSRSPWSPPRKLLPTVLESPEPQMRRHFVIFTSILVPPLLFVAFCFSVFVVKLHEGERQGLVLPGLEFASLPNEMNPCRGRSLTEATGDREIKEELSMGMVNGGVQSKKPETRPLRVFVYDLPSNFTTGFYSHPDSTKTPYASEWWIYQDIVHNAAERVDNSVAVRVFDTDDADVFFVPFMASQAFNCDRREHFLRHNFGDICGILRGKDHALQAELKTWLKAQPTWQRSGGIDHVIPAIHPLALNTIDEFLAPCVQLLVDFVFKHSSKASLAKDVIVPHSHLVAWLPDEQVESATSSTFLDRSDILLYFAGVLDRKGMGKLRSSLQEALRDEPGVLITGPKKGAGQADLTDRAVDTTAATMRRSKFCLDPAGDTPSSSRLFDAIVNLCIPVIISDDLEVPFEGQLNLSASFIFVREADAIKPGALVARLRGISDEEVLARKTELAKIRRHFTYKDSWRVHDSAPAMVWREIAARLPLIKVQMARRDRGVDRLHAATYDKLDPSRLMKADQ